MVISGRGVLDIADSDDPTGLEVRPKSISSSEKGERKSSQDQVDQTKETPEKDP